MNMRPLVALALVGAAAGLLGCPGVNVTPLPGTSASSSTGSSTAPTTINPPAAAGVSSTAGAASDAYAKAVDAVKANGYSAWRLYRIEGKNMAANGVATEQSQTWNVYIHTPSDNKSWQVAVVPGIGASASAVSQADAMFKAGYELDPSTWKVDSKAAVTAAGGSTSGSLWLYSPAEFTATKGKSSTNPVWTINAGSAGTLNIDATSGAVIR
jgi:hypothetical protein